MSVKIRIDWIMQNITQPADIVEVLVAETSQIEPEWDFNLWVGSDAEKWEYDDNEPYQSPSYDFPTKDAVYYRTGRDRFIEDFSEEELVQRIKQDRLHYQSVSREEFKGGIYEDVAYLTLKFDAITISEQTLQKNYFRAKAFSAIDSALKRILERAAYSNMMADGMEMRAKVHDIRVGSIELTILISAVFAGVWKFIKDYKVIRENVLLLARDVEGISNHISTQMNRARDETEA